MISIKQIVTGLVCLAGAALSIPAPAIDAATPAGFPWPLPSTYPRVPRNNRAVPPQNGSAIPVPTHFGLFGYSYDGTIVNQSYFTDVGNFYAYTWPAGHGAYDSGHGSYAYGIGPHQHIFAQSDGRIAYWTSPGIGLFLFETWATWHNFKQYGGDNGRDRLPNCTIIPIFDVLYCTADGQDFKFGYCNDTVQTVIGGGYDNHAVVWGPDIGPCTEMIINVRQVPKIDPYGKPFPNQS